MAQHTLIAGAQLCLGPQQRLSNRKASHSHVLSPSIKGWQPRVLQTEPKHSKTSQIVSSSSSNAAIPPTTNVVPSKRLRSALRSYDDQQNLDYVWTRNWWPVSPTDYFDPERPNTATLLGLRLVVWRHTSIRHGHTANEGSKANGSSINSGISSSDSSWVVQQDLCPHRLAPLSEGRLVNGGQAIACSYHGWQFGAGGSCMHLPELSKDAKAHATAKASPRTCVTTYPTHESDGMLYVWLDVSAEGLAAKQLASPPPLAPEVNNTPFPWIMFVYPVEYINFIETVMDPSHACFLHHEETGLFQIPKSVPMSGSQVDRIDPVKGFEWHHGGFSESTSGIKGVRSWRPPATTLVEYTNLDGSTTTAATMNVPAGPCETRVFARFSFAPVLKPQPPQHEAQQEQETQEMAGHSSKQHAGVITVSGEAQQLESSSNSNASTGSNSNSVTIINSNSNSNNNNTSINDGVSISSTGASSSSSSNKQRLNVGAATHDSATTKSLSSIGSTSASTDASTATASTITTTSTNTMLSYVLRILRGHRPHWLASARFAGQGIQDAVMMNRQKVAMHSNGLDARDYANPSAADIGVTSIHRWARLVGYPESLWGGNTGMSSQQQQLRTYHQAVQQDVPIERLLSHYDNHVKHCMECQKGFALVTKACDALTALSHIASTAAVAAVAVLLVLQTMVASPVSLATASAVNPAASSTVPTAMSSAGAAALIFVGSNSAVAWAVAVGFVLLAVLLRWAAVRLQSWRTDTFISGVPFWKRTGGLSLVKPAFEV